MGAERAERGQPVGRLLVGLAPAQHQQQFNLLAAPPGDKRPISRQLSALYASIAVGRTSAATSTPRAAAIRSTLSSETLRWLRSTELM